MHSRTTRSPIAAAVAATLFAAACGAVHADQVGVRFMQLEWDPRSPTQTPYVSHDLDGFVNTAVQQVWDQVRPQIIQDVIASVTRPDYIRDGVTLRDVDLKLSSDAPTPSLVSVPQDPTNGHIGLFLPNNSMDFTSTYPHVPRSADPKLSASFDLVVDISIHVNGKMRPPIEVASAVARPVNAKIEPRNVTSQIGLTVDDIVSTFTGGNKLRDMITSGINHSSLNLTGAMRAYLAQNANIVSLPPGDTFNGGRIEGNYIVIAGWHRKSLPTAWIPVTAHWDPNTTAYISCDALQVTVTVPYAPAPYGRPPQEFVTNELRATDPGRITDLGSQKQCSQSIASFAGVTGTVKYHETVGGSGKSYKPVEQWVVRAIPENWDNPFSIGQESATFRLETQHGGMGSGMNAPNQAYEAIHSNPIDPVARTRVTPDDRGARGALNPQPLPPHDPGTVAQPSAASQPSTATQAPSPEVRNGIIVIGGRALQRPEPNAPQQAPQQ